MAAYSSLWLLLLVITSAFRLNNGAIMYVRPSSSNNVTCPDQPCRILNDYVREKDRYFLDGTSFEFLSGEHRLDLQLRLESVSNVTLYALKESGSVQILFGPMVNITWLDSNNVTISGFDILLSGSSSGRSLFSALVFGNTTNCLLSKLNIFGNDSWQSTAVRTHTSAVNLRDVMISGATSTFGAVLIAFNSTINFAGQNYFVNNTATQGGAMAISQSVINFLDGQNYFVSNAAAQGGAMSLSQSVANFQGNVSFVDNIASTSSAMGGAIYSESSDLSFNSSVLFQRNTATTIFGAANGGGILATLSSKLTFAVSSSVVFAENSASFVGGAISVSGSELTIHGSALFEGNSAGAGGGALRGEPNSRILCRGGGGKNIIFRDNYASNGILASGGAIYTQSSFLELEGISFQGNMAGSGGAINSNDNFMHISTCDFANNTATVSSAVVFMGEDAVFNGTNSFQWNVADTGGTVSVTSANVIFSGENNFSNNTVSTGSGSITLSDGSGFIYGNLTFYGNHAFFGSGLYGIQFNLTMCGNSFFTKNSADSFGGGMMFLSCNLSFTGEASFIGNTAGSAGSAVFIRDSIATIGGSMNMSEGRSRKGSLSFNSSSVSLTGRLVIENSEGAEGGAINALDSNVTFLGCVECYNNLAYLSGGAMLATNSKISFSNDSDCNIFQTNVAGYRGGGFYAVDSTIYLSGSQKFIGNSAIQGGAIAFDSTSTLVLTRPLQARFIENNASVGGAIFYEDTFSARECAESIPSVTDRSNCFIEIESISNVDLSFINNTANSAGTVLYGGNLDHCRLYTGGGITDICGNREGGTYSDTPIAVINEISNSFSFDATSNISSDPLQICFCENGIPDCSDQERDTVRGKEFSLMALIVGQGGGIVPSSARTSLDNDIQISAAQRIQATGKECTPISYRLSSNKNTTTLVLFPDGPCRDTGISRREITINFLPCPDGFTLQGSECVCEQRLQKYTNSCSVDTSSIRRDKNSFWMGALYENGSFRGLILHPGCPFDYCIETSTLVKLDDLDAQCSHNHSGILCGSCISNYSIALGTLHCLPCSNVYLALILPFAFAGIALVAILLLLNISVASGTISGLIFYANVVQVNRSIFFPPGETNILTVFIAWLNLDLGIETCFFDGMNTYVFTWLQFLFPIYVWFLIALIIVASRFYDKVASALGNNPVAALATLLLLSYSKILRTIIVALSFTILEYPGNAHQVVWLYDGNVPYFQSARHIVLGTVAIVVLLLLFLPYTLLLLCGHWLQAYSDRWIFSWLNNIKPLMDAYHAPYKKESRYWTGLLLLVRCALFLTFAFNALGDASGNLLAIISVTVGLAGFAWLCNRIYENTFNDFLEVAFILNLCILAGGTYHVKETGGSQAGLAYTSVGIAFTLFACIVLYHMYLRLYMSALWEKIPKPDTEKHYILNKLSIILGHSKEKEDDDSEDELVQDTEIVQAPTTTTVELREPLLEK